METSSVSQSSLKQFFKISTILDPATLIANPEPEQPKKSKASSLSKDNNAIDQVPGLYLIKEFITPAEETFLLTETGKLDWHKFGSRFRLLLGWIHDRDNYGKMTRIGDLPEAFQFV